MITLGAAMVPAVAKAPVKALWGASRPLFAAGRKGEPQGISRRFECIDHESRDKVAGLVSIIGGKATTLRLMAEAAADLICKKLGRKIGGRTRTTPLLPHRAFYR